MQRPENCYNTKCRHLNRTMMSNCSEHGGNAIVKCLKHIKALEPATSSRSDETLGYAPPVQAIKDAMFIVEKSLAGNQLWSNDKEMGYRSLHELHNYLDKIGA